jgi:hypothetical protein
LLRLLETKGFFVGKFEDVAEFTAYAVEYRYEMREKLVPAEAGIAFLTGDATKKCTDFSKGRQPIHFPYPTASPNPVF